MRQLLGRTSIKHRNVVEEVYLCEHVLCQTCQITVPVGIEVVDVRREGQSRKVVRHCWYRRAHGADYAIQLQG